MLRNVPLIGLDASAGDKWGSKQYFGWWVVSGG